MLRPFMQHFTATHDRGNTPRPESLPAFAHPEFLECIDLLGGKTFNDGFYRVYQWSEVMMATERVNRLYTPTKGRIMVYASNWLGEQFAIDTKTLFNGFPTVKFFNLGIPDSLATDVDIVTFHNKDMEEQTKEGSAPARYYQAWHSLHPTAIPPDKCVGYKLPLFLGGQDVVENLELIDMDVYLRLCADLYHAAMRLPDGASVAEVVLSQGRATIFPDGEHE